MPVAHLADAIPVIVPGVHPFTDMSGANIAGAIAKGGLSEKIRPDLAKADSIRYTVIRLAEKGIPVIHGQKYRAGGGFGEDYAESSYH